MPSIANTYGSTAHVSPLLRKVKRFGLATPHSLLCLAVARGCDHYAPADYEKGGLDDPGTDQLPDAELGMAMISGAQEYDPQLMRCAAQLLSGPHLAMETLVRLARMERCEPVLGYIAEQARKWDEGREAFWDALVAALPPSRWAVLPAGTWPHPSRFMLQAGYRRGGGVPKPVWLRPRALPSR
jgi:hypothetical protein